MTSCGFITDWNNTFEILSQDTRDYDYSYFNILEAVNETELKETIRQAYNDNSL
jgi:hypothetical protein